MSEKSRRRIWQRSFTYRRRRRHGRSDPKNLTKKQVGLDARYKNKLFTIQAEGTEAA